jgi:hypothetical protein
MNTLCLCVIILFSIKQTATNSELLSSSTSRRTSSIFDETTSLNKLTESNPIVTQSETTSSKETSAAPSSLKEIFSCDFDQSNAINNQCGGSISSANQTGGTLSVPNFD